jgi:plastocyanin
MPRRGLALLAATLMALECVLLISTPSSAAGTPQIVEITDLGFSPSTVTIPPNSTVTWVNRDSEPHGITGEPGVPLDSPVLEARFSYSYTFHSTGTFAYHDSWNAAVTGTVLVVAGASAPGPTPGAPVASPTSVPTLQPLSPQGSLQSTNTGDDAAAGGALPAGGAQPAPLDASAVQSSSGEGSDSASGTGASPALASVGIQIGSEWFGDASFQGGVFESTISQGGTVEWTVQDGLHNVYECGANWGGASSSCGGAAWHSDQVVTAGGTYSKTLDSAGTFYYLCTIHPATMRGIITVQPAGDTADDPTPAPPTVSSGSSQDRAPTVAQPADVPQGGGPIGSSGDSRTTWILIGAAAAFVISTAGFIVGGGARG